MMLEEAERKQILSNRKQQESKDLEELADDGERHIHRLCNKMLENGRQRVEYRSQMERAERKVAQLGSFLHGLKREKENCRFL